MRIWHFYIAFLTFLSQVSEGPFKIWGFVPLTGILICKAVAIQACGKCIIIPRDLSYWQETSQDLNPVIHLRAVNVNRDVSLYVNTWQTRKRQKFQYVCKTCAISAKYIETYLNTGSWSQRCFQHDTHLGSRWLTSYFTLLLRATAIYKPSLLSGFVHGSSPLSCYAQ